MNANPGVTHPHRAMLIIAIVAGVFLGVFFLVPIVHVIDACSNNYESPSYYLFKVGLRIYLGPSGCLQ